MLPKRIIELRKKHNLTQEQLGDMLNVSKQAVGGWERGRTEPSVNVLINLSKIFGTSVDYLLGLNNENYSETNLLAETLNKLMSTDDLNFVSLFIKFSKLNLKEQNAIETLVDSIVNNNQ
ncbi:helix-turn-helix domain-containing protein [Enterococcus faecalis]|uniref:helix-turn-helix domain-containing protein n=1 Tax=Enterococcus faecalis TaxID=1351 RepID=UPI000FFEB70A|nr:helix-turn-helix domain-containing protein [Enterococcus faecalis]EGO2732892.1 helix-turn-helix domain-containing protein [Enterococcus faecalis]EHL2477810.1 helix-turn-helix domain-containing protein [Enterococcus faecalis]EHU5028927.1 helix-turn-helix domain-containing protein [Enterococcus faecalis]EKJ5043768.1 helix-turn-helix domain-containing protein [Enterococcus faecalis]MCU2287135.1 helix-turn-helix domain-containing protein [Enterococcus faecalis]